MTCGLCLAPDPVALPPTPDGRRYHRCVTCDLFALDPAYRLNASDERARYDLHRYEPDDAGYARFVAPLIHAVVASVPPRARGLDFGAGRVPLLAQALARLDLKVSIFDAIYHPDAATWSRRYDFITACEVVEHLYAPAIEFARLRDALHSGGHLLIMTNVRRDDVDFASWTYRRDPTHVSFYSHRTFRWIADAFGFKNMSITDRLVVLTTPEDS